MKRFIFSLAAFAAIAVGCTNKELDQVETPEQGSFTFKAIMSTPSKTSINDDGSMAWVTGDKIGVYDVDETGSGYFADFTLLGEGGSAEGTFTGELVYPDNANLAIFPADIASEVAGEMLTVTLSDIYEYDGESTNAAMIATGFAVNDSEATLHFKHLGGLFKITYNNVPEEAEYFCFKTSKKITGEFYIEDYTIENPVIEVTEETADSVTFYIESDHPSSMSFYVPVPVGTFDFSICLKDSEEKVIAKSNKKKSNFTVNRADYINIPAVVIPKTTEHFTANVDDVLYSSSKTFTKDENRSTYDFTWELVEGSTATVGHDFIKVGKSKTPGLIRTTDMLTSLSDGTIFTLKVFAANYPGQNTDLKLIYNDREFSSTLTNGPTSNESEYNASDFMEYDFVFQKADGINGFEVGGSNERILIDKIILSEGGDLPQQFEVSTTDISVDWDATEASFDVVASDLVSWEIVAGDGLTLSQDEGTGNATITVSFAANSSEKEITKEIIVATEYTPLEGDDTYTITLTQAGKPARDMDGDGTADNPYSVADALYLISKMEDGEKSSADVYVAGFITGDINISTEHGNAEFDIKDEDSDSDSEATTLKIYRAYDLGGKNFTATDQLKVDDYVVVKGKMYRYVKDQIITPEINAGGTIVSINGASTILDNITLSNAVESFYIGDPFVKPVVTANYRGKESTVVTDQAVFQGYDLSREGQQIVSVSYSENEVTKTAEYQINVLDGTPYSITLQYDSTKGTVETDKETARVGESVKISIKESNSDYIFKSIEVDGVAKTLAANKTYTFNMPAKSVTIVVEFEAKPDTKEYSKTFSYGLSGWTLTNYTDQSSYYQVPSGNDPSVATLNGIFSGKTIASDVVITIKCATYGSGTNPSASTFSIYKETECANKINATQGGVLPTSSTYTDVTYTVSQTDAASFVDDLAIKITKPGKTIRLNSITVTFSYFGDGSNVETQKLSCPTGLTWTGETNTISWTDTNTSNGAYDTDYKYQYRLGSTGSNWVDASSATTAVLSSLATTTTVYVRAFAINTTDYANSAETANCECTVSGGASWIQAEMAAGTNGSTATVNNKEAIKVGTSSKGGDMTITVPAGATKLTFYAAAWSGVSGLSLNITPAANVDTTSVTLTADTGISGNGPFTLKGSESEYYFEINLKDITAETTLTLTSSAAKRFIVWGAEYYK